MKLILLIILILINGIFSATEIAYLSLSKYELNKKLKQGNRKAQKIINLLNDSSTFLAAIQISITLSGFLASAIAAEKFASELSELINIEFLTTNVLIVIITIILSYFTLVFGELVPKRIGLAHSETIAFIMVDIIDIIIIVFKPFIIILRNSVNFIIKLLKIKPKKEIEEDNIKDNILNSPLEEFEKYLLLNVFEFNDTTVKDIMTNIENVITIDINTTKEELFKILKKHKYTRYPVTKNNKIIGILNVKDLVIKKVPTFNLQNYIRKIRKIDSKTIIDDAYFKLSSNHEVMVSVTNDNKEIIGIVTIEDIIEEIIPNIFDEYN